MENLASIALTVIEEVNKTFNDSLSKAKEQLKDMKPEEAKIVNEIIGKIEKLMKNVKMPSIESLKNPSELQRANNEIIHKLGEIQKELQNLQKVCLL
jgi:hypothetical protein